MKCCLMAACKLENRYLREWVEYNKKLGFDNIILSDNNEVDGENPIDVLKDYVDEGFVIIKDWRGVNPEDDPYYVTFESGNRNYNDYKDKYDWICGLDIDEFIVLDDYNNIKDFLSQSKFDNFDVIKLCWKIYGDDNKVKVEDGNYNIVNRFLNPSTKYPDWMVQVKSIMRCENNIKWYGMPHGIAETFDGSELKYCNAEGVKVEISHPYGNRISVETFKSAHINHYKTRTLEEYLELRKQRDNSSLLSFNHNNLSYFFNINELTQEKIDFIKDNYPEVEDELKYLNK